MHYFALEWCFMVFTDLDLLLSLSHYDISVQPLNLTYTVYLYSTDPLSLIPLWMHCIPNNTKISIYCLSNCFPISSTWGGGLSVPDTWTDVVKCPPPSGHLIPSQKLNHYNLIINILCSHQTSPVKDVLNINSVYVKVPCIMSHFVHGDVIHV